MAVSLLAAALAPPLRPQAASPPPASRSTQQPGPSIIAPRVKPEPKKAKEAYKRGLRAEQQADWEGAHQAYSNAVDWDPSE
jgi:hypothetical protein